MSHQCNGVDPAHDWHYIIGVGKFNCSKDFDAKIMVMTMMTMTMVMIENLEGGRNMAAWRVHVRPPIEHVVGAGEEEGDPAQLGLHEGELLPSQGGCHRGKRSDAEHHGQCES